MMTTSIPGTQPAQPNTAEMDTLLTIQQAIASRLDPDAVLQLIADGARSLTRTRLSIVYLLDGDKLRIAVLSGEHSPDIFVGYTMPVAESVAGFSIRTGQPVIVEDVHNDSRAYPDAVKRLNICCFMTMPLISDSQPIGVIAVTDREPGTLGPTHQHVLEMLASGAVISLQNARLYKEEQERRQEAERRHHVAESLRDILTVLNSNRPLGEILDYIVAQASQLLNSDAVAIYQLDHETSILSIQANQGLPNAYIAKADISVDQEALKSHILTHLPIVISNIDTALTANNLDPQRQALVKQVVDYYQSLLIVPLVVKDDFYGDLILYYSKLRYFSEDEINLAATFGDQAALAIENARLRTQAQEAAVTAERHRLARDLHDAVTQTLFSASLIAEVMPKVWARHPEEGQRSLEELRLLTRGALAEMRTLLLELRPSALTEAKLGTLLRHLTDAMTSRTRVPINLNVEGDCSLPPDVQIALYRIAQEALNNVAKHAEARQAIVALNCRPQFIELHIIDNGRGFDPAQISPGHMGLSIMRERAKTIDARLNIDSETEKGTEITVTWRKP